MKYSIIFAAVLATVGGYALAEGTGTDGAGGNESPSVTCDTSAASCDGEGSGEGSGEGTGEGSGEGTGEGGGESGGEGGGA